MLLPFSFGGFRAGANEARIRFAAGADGEREEAEGDGAGEDGIRWWRSPEIGEGGGRDCDGGNGNGEVLVVARGEGGFNLCLSVGGGL